MVGETLEVQALYQQLRNQQQVIEQLQGIEAPAGDWESEILPARVAGYDPRWLDELCLAGEGAWGRLSLRTDPALRRDRGALRPELEPESTNFCVVRIDEKNRHLQWVPTTALN